MTETHKLTAETYENLLSMVTSTDSENHTIAKALIGNLDPEENLVYLALLYKEIDNSTKRGEFFESKLQEKIFKKHFGIDENDQLDWEKIVKHFDAAKDTESLSFVLNRFAADVKSRLEDAGFSFLAKYNLNITSKNG